MNELREASDTLKIAIVGPCSAGKSTLAASLRAAGFRIRQPAQEHSFVPAMWQKFAQPDVLIYLDVSYSAAKSRRPLIDGGPERLAMQRERLAHARQWCDLYLDTSELAPQEVYRVVVQFLADREESKP